MFPTYSETKSSEASGIASTSFSVGSLGACFFNISSLIFLASVAYLLRSRSLWPHRRKRNGSGAQSRAEECRDG